MLAAVQRGAETDSPKRCHCWRQLSLVSKRVCNCLVIMVLLFLFHQFLCLWAEFSCISLASHQSLFNTNRWSSLDANALKFRDIVRVFFRNIIIKLFTFLF